METLDKPLGPTKPQTAHSLQTQSPYSNPDFVVREPKTPNSKLPEPKTPNPQTQIPKPKTPNPQTQNPKLCIVAKQPGARRPQFHPPGLQHLACPSLWGFGV